MSDQPSAALEQLRMRLTGSQDRSAKARTATELIRATRNFHWVGLREGWISEHERFNSRRPVSRN